MINHNLVRGINIPPTHFRVFHKKCEICALNKSSKLPFPKTAKNRSQKILGYIHTDVAGPFNPDRYGNKYLITFIDDYSRYAFVYYMKKKSETLDKFKEFIKYARTEIGSIVQSINVDNYLRDIRSDNGGEYTSTEFNDYCLDNNIKHNLTVPYSPQSNGVAERYNRSLMAITRSLINNSDLNSFQFWTYACRTANYIKNRTAHSANLSNKSPFQAFYRKKPSVSYFKIFGCLCYIHKNRNERKSKILPTSYKGYFIGYAPKCKGYLVYIPERGEVLTRRNIIFNERLPDDPSLPTKIL